jgi:hypothetical protein
MCAAKRQRVKAVFLKYHRDRVTHSCVRRHNDCNGTANTIYRSQSAQHTLTRSRQRRSLQLLYNLRRYGPAPTANVSNPSICVNMHDGLASTCRTVSIPRWVRMYAKRTLTLGADRRHNEPTVQVRTAQPAGLGRHPHSRPNRTSGTAGEPYAEWRDLVGA